MFLIYIYKLKINSFSFFSSRISCFFVFDKDASADLNNDLGLATEYATQLALSASNYTAMVNTVVINAGTEIWAYYDRISFDVGTDVSLAMMNILIQFQEYLGATQQTNFGTVYAVGVLISKKSFVQGGYSQGPPCTTSGKFVFAKKKIFEKFFLGASLINYRQIPYTIGGLVAHELAHTLSVVHPFELSYLCDSSTTTLDFCYPPNSIPHSCLCDNATYFPPQQCLMTFQFGAANIIAPKYTICDIKMMNYFSSNISCLIKVKFIK